MTPWHKDPEIKLPLEFGFCGDIWYIQFKNGGTTYQKLRCPTIQFFLKAWPSRPVDFLSIEAQD